MLLGKASTSDRDGPESNIIINQEYYYRMGTNKSPECYHIMYYHQSRILFVKNQHQAGELLCCVSTSVWDNTVSSIVSHG